MFFGVLIITVVYVPILALQGIEGKMFKPMAVVVMLALGGSLVLALTLMPVLCSFFLRRQNRGEGQLARHAHQAHLHAAARISACASAGSSSLPMFALFGWSLFVFSRLGAEFIPQLDEGDFTFQLIRSSSAGLAVVRRFAEAKRELCCAGSSRR